MCSLLFLANVTLSQFAARKYGNKLIKLTPTLNTIIYNLVLLLFSSALDELLLSALSGNRLYFHCRYVIRHKFDLPHTRQNQNGDIITHWRLLIFGWFLNANCSRLFFNQAEAFDNMFPANTSRQCFKMHLIVRYSVSLCVFFILTFLFSYSYLFFGRMFMMCLKTRFPERFFFLEADEHTPFFQRNICNAKKSKTKSKVYIEISQFYRRTHTHNTQKPTSVVVQNSK